MNSYKATPGETIYGFARQIHTIADTWVEPVELVFNDRRIVVEPNTLIEDTVRKYFDMVPENA